MRRVFYATLVFACFVVAAQDPWPGRGDPGRGAALEDFLNREIAMFHSQTPFPPAARRAVVMNDLWMSTETYEFFEEREVCPSDDDWEPRLK